MYPMFGDLNTSIAAKAGAALRKLFDFVQDNTVPLLILIVFIVILIILAYKPVKTLDKILSENKVRFMPL